MCERSIAVAASPDVVVGQHAGSLTRDQVRLHRAAARYRLRVKPDELFMPPGLAYRKV
jgi:hypothetical protein